MKLLEKLLKAKSRDFVVIKAHADGPNRLLIALEAFAHETDTGATCVIAVDLTTLAVDLIHEAAGYSVDYVHANGWHGLVQPKALVELGGTKPIVTELGADGRLSAVARLGEATLVAGTKRVGKYDVDGFVARVSKGTLNFIAESSKAAGHPGPFHALAVSSSGKVYAAGAAMTVEEPLRIQLFHGDAAKLTATPLRGNNEVYALNVNASGDVMVGCRDAAELVGSDGAVALSGAPGRVQGVTVFRGTEYWMGHDGNHVTLCRRTGTKLAKKYRTKYHYVGYRSLSGTPEARMTSTDDLLVVTNNDRIHIFDGKKWAQLGLQPDVKKLVKRLPTAMK
jgi:hypothetical protein